MRNLILLPLVGIMSACQPGDGADTAAAPTEVAAAADPAADEQAIRAQVDKWHELMKAKDAAGIAGLYTADGAVMPPNAPIGKGADALKTVWTALVNTPGFELKIMPETIVVAGAGDMAMDRGTYSLTVAPDGTAQTDTGKYVVVWRKVDGQWKAAADIFNSDLPAGGGA